MWLGYVTALLILLSEGRLVLSFNLPQLAVRNSIVADSVQRTSATISRHASDFETSEAQEAFSFRRRVRDYIKRQRQQKKNLVHQSLTPARHFLSKFCKALRFFFVTAAIAFFAWYNGPNPIDWSGKSNGCVARAQDIGNTSTRCQAIERHRQPIIAATIPAAGMGLGVTGKFCALAVVTGTGALITTKMLDWSGLTGSIEESKSGGLTQDTIALLRSNRGSDIISEEQASRRLRQNQQLVQDVLNRVMKTETKKLKNELKFINEVEEMENIHNGVFEKSDFVTIGDLKELGVAVQNN